MTKVNGELISIDDSAYDGFKGMTIYGKTVQNLWVNPSGTTYGVTAKENSDGSVTLSGTATSGNHILSKTFYSLKSNTTYTLSIDATVGTGYSFQLRAVDSDGAAIANYIAVVGGTTFTTPANTVSGSCLLFMNASAPDHAVSGTYRVMLNEGSTASLWVPPESESCVRVVTAGKNLVEGVQKFFTDSRYFAKVYMFGGQQYAVSLETNAIECYLHDKNGAYNTGIKINVNISVDDGRCYGLMTAPYTGLFYISLSTVQYPSNTIQLELGSTATDYEPPNITTIPIDLQGHTLNALPDGTRDELHIDGGGNVVLEKRVGAATAPTSAGSWFWETAGDGIASFTLPAKSTGTQADMTEIMRCDKLPVRQKSGEASYAMVGTTQGHAKNPAITSAATAATVAGGATYLYQLATPQTIQLGKISLPKLRKKPLVNNIWANGTASGTGFSLAPEIDYEYNQWSTYCDGFRTHGKHSYFDMGCCIAARDTGTPEKKSVTATVPYMSGFYDLSKLYGAIAFEARQLMYRFEFVEDSREELQQRKSQFLEWLSQVHDEEIADDDIPGRHFIGSLSEWEFEEGEEGQSGSLEVTFNCQPFLEADEDTTKTCNAGSNTVTVAGQAVNAYAKTNSGTATIRIGGVTQSVGTTEIRLSVQLQPGDNAVTITGSPVVLRWKELTV